MVTCCQGFHFIAIPTNLGGSMESSLRSLHNLLYNFNSCSEADFDFTVLRNQRCQKLCLSRAGLEKCASKGNFKRIDPTTSPKFYEIQPSTTTPISTSLTTAIMGRVRTKTVKKSAKVIIERYYPKLTLDFETNKRICDEIAIIASKRLRNKV